MAELALVIKEQLPNHIGTLFLIVVMVAMFGLELSKAKVNPVSSICNFLGKFSPNRKYMEQTLSEVKKIREDVDQVKLDVDQNEIDRIRWEILSFANSCHSGTRHAREEFDHIFEVYDKYHKLLEAHGKKNGKIDREYAYLEKVYARAQDSDGFIDE